MRDFRDAKAMAQTLRESLTTKAINVSHSESLELVSKMLGVSDWNTLSALLQADRRDTGASVVRPRTAAANCPAVPLRDLVPFPTATYPLFVGREKTMHALSEAFERQREVVLAVQRNSAIDEPRFEDVYEIGVLAQLLEIERMSDRTLKVLVQGRRRVLIRSLVGATGAFERQREVVLAIQRDSAVDEPRFEDIYEIGVLAQLLDIERMSDRTLKAEPAGNTRSCDAIETGRRPHGRFGTAAFLRV